MRASFPAIRQARCNVCEHRSVFVSRTVPRHGLSGGLRCVRCGSRSRNRHVVVALTQALRHHGVGGIGDLATRADLRVLNTSSDSPIARRLSGVGHVDNTSWWPDVASGETREGVRCEDLTALSYRDRSLDLVITEDVLEHIPRVDEALAEIRRVLKPGGVHVFSIPFRPDRPGAACFDLVGDEIRLHEPAEHHTDPARGRIPVFHHFGHRLFDDLAAAGFSVRLVDSTYRDLRRNAIADARTFITRRR